MSGRESWTDEMKTERNINDLQKDAENDKYIYAKKVLRKMKPKKKTKNILSSESEQTEISWKHED